MCSLCKATGHRGFGEGLSKESPLLNTFEMETELLCLLSARSCAGLHRSARRQGAMRLRVSVHAAWGQLCSPRPAQDPPEAFWWREKVKARTGFRDADQGIAHRLAAGASGRKSPALLEGHLQNTGHRAVPRARHMALLCPQPPCVPPAARAWGVQRPLRARRQGPEAGSAGPRLSLPLLEPQIHRQRVPSCKVTPRALKKCPLHQQTPLRSWLIFREREILGVER